MEQNNEVVGETAMEVDTPIEMDGIIDGGKKEPDDTPNLKSPEKPDAVEKTMETVAEATPSPGVNGSMDMVSKPEKVKGQRGRPRKNKLPSTPVTSTPIQTPTSLAKPLKRTFSESDDPEFGEFRGFKSEDRLYAEKFLKIVEQILVNLESKSDYDVNAEIAPFSKSDVIEAKLKADAKPELSEVVSPLKRMRKPSAKVRENAEVRALQESVDAEDSENHTKADKSAKEVEMEKAGFPFNSDTDTDHKEDFGSLMAGGTTPTTSRRGRRSSNQSSGSSPRQIDMKNPMYKKPFDLGWKREVVYRTTVDPSSGKRQADIYYYPPNDNANRKKVRSMKELAEFLYTEKVSNLTTDNFTYFKEPMGFDEAKEIVRDARAHPGAPPGISRQSASAKVLQGNTSTTFSAASTSSANVSFDGIFDVTSTPKQPSKAGRKKKIKIDASMEISSDSSSSVGKTKDIPNEVSLKTKVAKKEAVKKDLKLVEKEEKDLPQQGPSGITRRSVQGDELENSLNPETSQVSPATEKVVSKGGKKGSKRKNVQEPCSARCSRGSGLPSLQCSICLCYYHAECVFGFVEVDTGQRYVCKNCKDDTDETTSTPFTSVIPHLIPIEHLPSVQNNKFKPQNAQHLPTLQKLPRNPENRASVSRGADEPKKKKDFFNAHEVMSSLPAQNLAVMNGKKYIVIPKDNAMAVQPAITGKHRERARWDRPQNLSLENQDTDVKKMETNESKWEENEDVEKKSGVKKKSSSRSDEDDEIFDNEEILKSNLQVLQRAAARKRLLQTKEEPTQFVMANVCAVYQAMVKTFQYLTVQDLLRAGRVCKMWNNLATQPAFWSTVRMKNSRVSDWEGFAEALNRYQTQHLDLKKIIVEGSGEKMWSEFAQVIPKVSSLRKLELCRCTATAVEAIIQNGPRLENFNATLIKCDTIDLSSINNMKHCTKLKLRASSSMALAKDLAPFEELTQLVYLSLTSVRELATKNLEVIKSLTNLETLELGECVDLPESFGTEILPCLTKLECLRLEKGQEACNTFSILEGVSKLPKLTQLELVNFDIKRGFDVWLAKCTNVKKLLIIPTYISQSATSNNMILSGVTQLKDTLTLFVWGVTLELLRVTELFVDQCHDLRKKVTEDSIPILKPTPCADLIKDLFQDVAKNTGTSGLVEMERGEGSENLPEVDILMLQQLQRLLLLALPKTRVKILKIPFHATWRQSISDNSTQ